MKRRCGSWFGLLWPLIYPGGCILQYRFSGGGKAGECTGTTEILSDNEINRVLKEYDLPIQYDEAAGVNWMIWNTNQWVSFNNAWILKQKADFANSNV
ncbi:hypothetical protein N7453_009991 [Penicillium expansum]|nr:hypothetical protein N7453_009991 [Penicillium expansum]